MPEVRTFLKNIQTERVARGYYFSKAQSSQIRIFFNKKDKENGDFSLLFQKSTHPHVAYLNHLPVHTKTHKRRKKSSVPYSVPFTMCNIIVFRFRLSTQKRQSG